MSDRNWHELEARLERALDALNADQAPPTFEDDDAEYLELVDMARVVQRLRDPSEPDADFPRELAAHIAAGRADAPGLHEGIGPNHRGASSSVHVDPPMTGSVTLLAQLGQLVYTLGAGVIAGALAGIIAGGIGGRIAMRVSGIFYLREHPNASVTTESSGRIVGEFSVGGTVDLLVESMFLGIAGGLLYTFLRRWLSATGLWRGLVFGITALAIAGTMTIDAENADFARLGIPWLNVLMFSLIFLLFGLIAAPVADRILAQRNAARSGQTGTSRIGMLHVIVWPAGLLGMLFGGMVIAAATILGGRELIRSLVGPEGAFDAVPGVVALSVALILPLLHVLTSAPVLTRIGARSPTQTRAAQDWQRYADRAGRLTIGVVTILGSALLIHTTYLIVT